MVRRSTGPRITDALPFVPKGSLATSQGLDHLNANCPTARGGRPDLKLIGALAPFRDDAAEMAVRAPLCPHAGSHKAAP